MSSVRWSISRTRSDPERAASELASRGGAEGTVLVRQGSSFPTLGLSVILRPSRPRRPDLLRLVIQFSTSEAIRKDTGIISWLAWPDRVVVDGMVVARTSMTTAPSRRPEWVVLSSSINTSEGERAILETSLFQLLGVDVDQGMLVEKVLESLSWMYVGWALKMDDHIVKRYTSMLEALGRRTRYYAQGRARVGRIVGVDRSAGLLVEFRTGRESIGVDDAGRLKEI